MNFKITFIGICFLLVVNDVNSNKINPSLNQLPQTKDALLTVSRSAREVTSQSPAITTISRASSDFCQVRIDFVRFSIGEPSANGTCDEGWTVSGHNNSNNVPSGICGSNDGQHLYLNFDGDNSITIVILFDDSTGTDYWNFEFTQIACDDEENLAPSGCLQYYTETSGTIKSFNFQTISEPPGTIVNYQISNLDYNICLGSPSNTLTRATYSKAVGATSYYFVLTEAIGLFTSTVAGTIDAAVIGSDCQESSPSYDYVEIPSGQYKDADGNSQTASLFCGVGFPSTVSSYEKPFTFHVFANGYEHSLEGSVGFYLSYILS